MIDFSKVDLATWRIKYFGTMQREIFDQKEDVIEGKHDNSKFWAPGLVPTLRPTLSLDKTEITTGGDDEALATGLPDPFILDIDGVEVTITGGTLRFYSPIPGTYTLTPKTFPYREQPIEVVVL